MKSSEGSNGGMFLNRRRMLTALAAVAAGSSSYLAWNAFQRRKEVDELLRARGIPRSSPAVVSRVDETRELLEKHFAVIAGNAPLEEAKVVGIGEIHHSFGDAYGLTEGEKEKTWVAANAIGKMLGAVVRDGDHFLLEALDRGQPDLRPMGPMVMEYPWMIGIRKKQITVGGWDDLPTKNDASLSLREGAMLRNERGMIPAIVENARKRRGRVFAVAGVGHFLDDPRVDGTLEKENIPYLLLGEKAALNAAGLGVH